MPEFSKLEWIIPREFPDQEFEQDIYCLGKRKYILKNKDPEGPMYYCVMGYSGDNCRALRPEEYPADLAHIKTYRVSEQIERKNRMIEEMLEYLDTLPEYTLLRWNELREKVFGRCEFIEPSTLHYPSFDLEESMLYIFHQDLEKEANLRGVFFVDLDDLMEDLEGYEDSSQFILRKNGLRKEIRTEEQDELIKETFSGHSVHVIYSYKENRVMDIRLEENPHPVKKAIPGFRQKEEEGSHLEYSDLYEDGIFAAAFENDLNSLKETVKKGADIRAHDEHFGYSVLSAWLDGYYSRFENDHEETIYRRLNSYSYGDFPPDILCVPLEHRNDGLLEAIEWMLENGLELSDGYSADHDISETPLSLSIQYMDYYLTEYLLEKGEDPYEWVRSEPEEREDGEKDDTLGRTIAYGIDESEDFVNTSIWLKFAKLLRKYGYTGTFEGSNFYFSLIIHEEDDTVEWKQTAFNLF